MTPEITQKFEDMQTQIDTLRALAEQLSAQAGLDPNITRTIELIIGNESEYIPTDYDRVVNEGGALSYEVPTQFDGLSIINGKLYGYYNP
jgi:hypothetical protein